MNDKPNILIFMTDQQRGDTIFPEHQAITPNMDKFLKEGVLFSKTFAPSPHCCPARATFMTGLYPAQHGVWNNVNVGNTLSEGLNEGVKIFSDFIPKDTYDFYYSGKWHVDRRQGPEDFGWTEQFLTCGPTDNRKHHAWDNYKKIAETPHQEARERGEILRPGYPEYIHYGSRKAPFGDNLVVDAGVEIMERHDSDKPWIQFVGTLGPHDPYVPPQRFIDMYSIDDITLPSSFGDELHNRPNLYKRTKSMFDQLSEQEHKEAILHYLAFCTYEDFLFGQVLEALEKSGQQDNTLVLFCSDHGDYMAEHGLWCKGLPCFRGAYHVPAAVRWPTGIKNPGRTVDAFVSLADFAPTFIELAGGDVPEGLVGRSLVPFLNDETPENWRRELFTQSNGNELYGIQRSIMTEKWKYVFNGYDFDELYDLENDPDEMHNLIEHGEIPEDLKSTVRDLCARNWRFSRDTADTCTSGYIMVGLAPYGPAEAFKVKGQGDMTDDDGS